MFEFFLLAFFAGILVKLADDLEDLKKKTILRYGKFAIALSYGAIIGFLISRAEFGMLFLGALLAQLLARKIDAPSHILGFIVAILISFYAGFPIIVALPFVIFMAAAGLDELEFKGSLKPFSDYRLFLKIAAFGFILFGRTDYFIAIIAFDLGYVVSGFASGKHQYTRGIGSN